VIITYDCVFDGSDDTPFDYPRCLTIYCPVSYMVNVSDQRALPPLVRLYWPARIETWT